MAATVVATPTPSPTPTAEALSRADSSQGFCFNHNFMRDNPGKLEDFYDVAKSNLGEGSFGSVALAKCKRTKCERAVKTIDLGTVKNPQRFEHEIAIQRQLDHPNVVRLYETFRDARKLYLVMELCSGGELFDRIVEEAPHGFDEIRAASYIRQMLAALCYLHAMKIAHRDVKPENFLLADKTRDAHLKIIDFGLASAFDNGQVMKTKAGTAYYVAPEVVVVRGSGLLLQGRKSGLDGRKPRRIFKVLKGSYGEKCDIWSCGVISFVLLCGYPPFAGETDPQILAKVKEGTFEFRSPEWDGISSGSKNLITQMLTMDVSCRPSAGELLQNPWLNFKSQPASGPICKTFMTRLKSFRAHTRLKKVALTVVAQQLKDGQVDILQNTFRVLDKNGDGTITTQEIRDGLTAMGMTIPPGLDDIFKTVDTNGTGKLDYSEFLAATIDKAILLKKDVCWEAFRVFDLDGDGKLSREELGQLLRQHSDDPSKVIDDAKIQKMIDEVDASGDGYIDFEEFCAMLRGPAPPTKKRRLSEGAQSSPGTARGKAKAKAAPPS